MTKILYTISGSLYAAAGLAMKDQVWISAACFALGMLLAVLGDVRKEKRRESICPDCGAKGTKEYMCPFGHTWFPK